MITKTYGYLTCYLPSLLWSSLIQLVTDRAHSLYCEYLSRLCWDCIEVHYFCWCCISGRTTKLQSEVCHPISSWVQVPLNSSIESMLGGGSALKGLASQGISAWRRNNLNLDLFVPFLAFTLLWVSLVNLFGSLRYLEISKWCYEEDDHLLHSIAWTI